MTLSKVPPAAFRRTRRIRRRPAAASGENALSVRRLLRRLQNIVPEAPKHRSLSQMQVIQHVIDYICRLEDQVAADWTLTVKESPERDVSSTYVTDAASCRSRQDGRLDNAGRPMTIAPECDDNNPRGDAEKKTVSCAGDVSMKIVQVLPVD